MNEEIIPVGVALTEEKPISSDSKINLVITQQILEVLRRYDLSLSQLFILLALNDEAIDLLDYYDGDLTIRKVLVEDYQHLHIHGFIRVSSEEGPVYALELKGRSFVEQIRILFDLGEEKATDLKELVSAYLDLWPRIKLPSGVYARINSTEIEKKLKSFIKTYKGPLKRDYSIKLTGEVILEATKAYIARFAKVRYQFMVNSSYFISKREKSTLADEIIASSQGLAKSPKNNFVTQ